MSTGIAAQHGDFGRACVYALNRPMAMHAHREGHLIFHLSGPPTQCTVAGCRVDINAHSAMAVNPLQPHNFESDGQSTIELLVLYINPTWFQTSEAVTDAVFRFGSSQIQIDSAMHADVVRIAQLLETNDPDCLLTHHLKILIKACYRLSWNMAESAYKADNDTSVATDHRIRKSILLMKSCVGEDMQLDDVARAVGLSRPHFFRLFRDNLGVTPNVYLNTLRMELAIDRLIHTDQAVTLIGLDLGFSSQASFTRFFAANVGISPTGYRRVAHIR